MSDARMSDARTTTPSTTAPSSVMQPHSSTPPGAPPALAPRDQMLQMLCGAWVAQSLSTAARLGLADALARTPQTSAELARAANVLPGRLERLLRALASVGVFVRGADGKYENTPLSETLRSGTPASVNAIARMHGEEQYVAWSRFEDCLRTGKTAFELEYGAPIFAWYGEHPEQTRTFNAAMQEYSVGQIEAVAAGYDASQAKLIVDVGGGHGQLLRALLARAPKARGIVFDLEQGLMAARAIGLDRDPRVQLVAGNFFESVAEGGDLYVLKHILHDWDDELCVEILNNIAVGLAPGGKVLAIEMLVAPDNVPDPAKWLDLHMLAMPGGKERTAEEFAALFARAGLKLLRVTPTPSGMWLIEADAA